MGEANEILRDLSTTQSYRAFRNPVVTHPPPTPSYIKSIQEGHMLVHQYDHDRLECELTAVEFRRDYNSLRIAHNESRNLKIWEVLSENKKAIKGRDFSKQTTDAVVNAADN